MAEDDPAHQGPEGEKAADEGPGQKTVPAWVVVLGLLWFIALSGLDLYCLTSLWPHPTPGTAQPASTTTAPASTPDCTKVAARARSECDCTVYATQEHNRFYSGSSKADDKFDPSCARLFGCWFVLWGETRLLLIVMLCGFLGALIYSVRSFLWYVGNRNLVRSWLALYALVPLVGAMLAVVFYLLLRGGLFSPSTTISDTSPFGFAALSALVGMFTNQAAEKLRSIFEQIMQKPATGKDSTARSAPVIATVSPVPAGKDGKITITGEHFFADSKVYANDAALDSKFVSDKEIDATIPASMIPDAHASVTIYVATPNGGKSSSVKLTVQ